MEKALPSIPAKRYFTIGEVGDLCGVKPHVLRYWEQEFTQLRPMKRRGNRRYYQHHEVLMIRRIRELLYEQGFTISGARNKMQETLNLGVVDTTLDSAGIEGLDVLEIDDLKNLVSPSASHHDYSGVVPDSMLFVRRELHAIRALLSLAH